MPHVWQSGVPHHPRGQLPLGVLVRGVVVATYVSDDQSHPRPTTMVPGIYCDVLLYTSIPGRRWAMLKEVAVLQPGGSGMHRGAIWKPRAATLDVTGAAMDIEKTTNPVNMDGDHVLVGFMDGSLNQPIILGAVEHPSADVGNEDKDIGQRRTLTLLDGDPSFWKHHGSYFGVADNGDFLVDTTMANDGEPDSTGAEPPVSPTDGSGSQTYSLPQDAVHTVQLMNGETPVSELVLNKTTLSFKLNGEATKHVAIVEALESLYTSLKGKLDAADAHVHSCPPGGGPSGLPVPTIGAPAWDPGINSTVVEIPDG